MSTGSSLPTNWAEIPNTVIAGPSDTGASGSSRKERGAIAAQACETCRTRKQKCGEQRPRCATCTKLNLNCVYREVQPTKKDKTQLETLDGVKSIASVLKRIERKLDNALSRQPGSVATTDAALTAPLQTEYAPAFEPGISNVTIGGRDSPSATSRVLSGLVPSAIEVLAWPAVRSFLETLSEPTAPPIDPDVPSVLLHDLQTELSPLPTYTDGPAVSFMQPTGLLSSQLSPRVFGLPNFELLVSAYFNVFNPIRPILDSFAFPRNAWGPDFASSLNDDSRETALTYLVLALGEVAIASTQDPQIDEYHARPSGVRGGGGSPHPGLGFFNNARRRMGFHLTDGSLETAQALVLASVYYETTFRHADFSRMTRFAGRACQSLVKSARNDPRGLEGCLRQNLFWHCETTEGLLRFEFDSPATEAEGVMSMPGTLRIDAPREALGGLDGSYGPWPNFQARTELLKLTADLFGSPEKFPDRRGSSQREIDHDKLAEATTRLAEWRDGLPQELCWLDETVEDSPRAILAEAAFFGGQANFGQSHTMTIPGVGFTSALDSPPMPYQPGPGIQAALLQTHYHLARHQIKRPYIYKLLHQHRSDQVSLEDVRHAIEGLEAGLLWPITLPPTSRHKRLIPHMFMWSQNLLCVLVLLRLARQIPQLVHWLPQYSGTNFGARVQRTEQLYIDWIRDLKDVDATARWCWRVVGAMYHLHDG